ncbi:hypothetical protein Gohar_006721 [Gossypium harknessii]|uniref:RNase H type-1 domain-containing protein n=1 Tax=Gossypium harknessii TaxID=34285 RepID=A0A7J9GEI4_9ROSI|nr:hypothetical protein [Gossypium harknessii]
MAACTYPNEHVLSSTMVEAQACLQAVILTEELGFKKVFVEGDALTVIKRVKVVEEDKSNISNLVKEIKERFCIFDKIEFRYVSLKANEVAHALATEGRRYEIPKYWIEEALKKVEDLANQDRSGLEGEG